MEWGWWPTLLPHTFKAQTSPILAASRSLPGCLPSHGGGRVIMTDILCTCYREGMAPRMTLYSEHRTTRHSRSQRLLTVLGANQGWENCRGQVPNVCSRTCMCVCVCGLGGGGNYTGNQSQTRDTWKCNSIQHTRADKRDISAHFGYEEAVLVTSSHFA